MFTRLTKSQHHWQRLLFLVVAYFYDKVNRICVVDRNYNGDNVNLIKIYPCFSFDDVTNNVERRSTKNTSLQQSTEAVVREPAATATPPPPTLWWRPTDWEPLA